MPHQYRQALARSTIGFPARWWTGWLEVYLVGLLAVWLAWWLIGCLGERTLSGNDRANEGTRKSCFSPAPQHCGVLFLPSLSFLVLFFPFAIGYKFMHREYCSMYEYFSSDEPPLRTKTLWDYNIGKGRMVCWHYSYIKSTWITVFLPEDTGNVPPWSNMVVGEVQWYIRQYDPAETHNVPAVRFGMDFYISTAALWWREEGSHLFLPENQSVQSYSLTTFVFSHTTETAIYPCELLASPTGRRTHTLPISDCPINAVNPAVTPSQSPKAQSTTRRQTAHSLREKWWNTFHHAVKFKSSSDLPRLSWFNLKLYHVAARCRMDNPFRPPIVSQWNPPKLENTAKHV